MRAWIIVLSAIALASVSAPAAAAPQSDNVANPLNAASPKATPTSFNRKPKVGTKAKCPIMKAEFKISASSKYSKYKGRYYFFCCPGCKPTFDKNPSKYAGK